MSDNERPPGEGFLLARDRFDELLQALRARGYRVIGPTVRGDPGSAAVLLDEIRSVDELPVGWGDAQSNGTYRLRRRDDQALFGFSVGPHSFKQQLFVPVTDLVRLRRRGTSFEAIEAPPEAPKLALFGARSCDLHAIAIQDQVFTGGVAADPDYLARRRAAFIVAVSCNQAGGTCFCASMGTGPRATSGYDLALTELLDAAGHRFLVESGSAAGAELVAALALPPAGQHDFERATEASARAAAQMGRTFDTRDVRDLLLRNLEHPRWDDVAGRCLACTNCTLVCPTCFCFAVEDTTDITGEEARRTRRWDSCFTADHSYLHGGSVHASVRSRYRQWLTHKVATWYDQFGVSGCVGCGRCITFCPAGIDLTEEVAAIRASDGAQAGEAAAGAPGEPAAPAPPH